MPTPLLPRLNESNSLAITKRGEWVSTSQNSLGNLVKSLKVSVNRQANVTSIPDLWAHPAMVEMALLGKNHLQHEFYKNQWRGIVAMLALYSARNIKELDVKTYKVTAASLQDSNTPEFLKVLVGMAPKYKNKAEQDYWIQVVTYNKKPLAFVWPSIFVCPAIEIGRNDSLGSSVSWWRTFIEDPIPQLSVEEKALLKDWLVNAKKHVTINEEQFLKLIQEFEEDLNIDDEKPAFQDSAKKLGFKGDYDFLSYNKEITLDSDGLKKSNVRLINQKGDTSLKNLLVITPDMAEQWNVPANEIVVAGSVTLDTAKAQCWGGVIVEKNRTMLNGNDISDFAELRSSGDFFTDKVGIVYGEQQVFTNDLKPIVRTYNGSTVSIILPIKEELLGYLNTEYIKDNVDVIVEDENITVSLNLPLSGPGKERKLKISKTYGSDFVREFYYTPLIQMWPNFIPAEANQNERSRWEAYYSFYSAPVGWEENFFYAKPYWKHCERRTFEEAQNYGEILRSTTFPEAYVCHDRQNTLSGKSEKEIGVVLLDLSGVEKLNSTTTPKKCRIGIDFGTTNTVSYYGINGGEPKILRFNERLYSITNVTAENKDELRRNFFSSVIQPSEKQGISSIRSIFHTYLGGELTNTKLPMMNGNIYYLVDGFDISSDEYMLERGNLHDDMKWNSDGVDCMTDFLVQYTMQCMAEAVVKGATQVEWAYSYPKSFTQRQIRSLKNIWQTSVARQLKEINNLSTEIDNGCMRAESVAMAEYFSNKMRGNVQRGMVCMDIGGGSTDIAVWQGTETSGMRYQCSLKFAGRHIFNDYLLHVRENGKQPFSDLKWKDEKYNSLLGSIDSSNPEYFNLKLESMLKYHEKELFDILNSKSVGIGSKVSIILRDIAFGLAGTLYYVGKIVSYLRAINNYDELDKLPECYVGGNASKLFIWAGAGVFDPEIASKFAACFTWGMDSYGKGLPDVSFQNPACYAKVKSTEDAKEEVAYGLVKNTYITIDAQTETSGEGELLHRRRRPIATESSTLISDIVAGENFFLDGSASKSDIITKEDILNSIISVDEKCPEFAEFVAAFNDAFKGIYVPVDFNYIDYSEICQNVNNELINQHRNGRNDADNIVVEPLFIMLLREAMDRLASK